MLKEFFKNPTPAAHSDIMCTPWQLCWKLLVMSGKLECKRERQDVTSWQARSLWDRPKATAGIVALFLQAASASLGLKVLDPEVLSNIL